MGQAVDTNKDKQSASDSNPEWAKGANDFVVGSLITARKQRDLIDAGISNIHSLSGPQRLELSERAAVTSVLMSTLYNMGPRDHSVAYDAGPRADAFDSIGIALRMDTSKIPQMQYEAMVRQVWKAAKKTLDDYFEKPEIKKLLANQSDTKK